MADNGIRTPNLPNAALVEVLGHYDAGGGTRALGRASLNALVDALRGIISNDPSGIASLRNDLTALEGALSQEAQDRQTLGTSLQDETNTRATIVALQALQDLLQQEILSEAQDRQTLGTTLQDAINERATVIALQAAQDFLQGAINAERQDRQALGTTLQDEIDQRATVAALQAIHDALQGAISSEAQARQTLGTALQAEIDERALTTTVDALAQTVAEKASQSSLAALGVTVGGKAAQTDFVALSVRVDQTAAQADTAVQDLQGLFQQEIAAEAHDRQTLGSTLQDAVSARATLVQFEDLLDRLARINAGLYPSERPGDNPNAFTATSSGGDPDARAPLDPGVYPIRVVGDGLGVEISGSREVWTRSFYACEPGRLWHLRWRLTRTADAQDPDGDAVVRQVAWYGPNRNLLSVVTVASDTPVVADGPRETRVFLGDSGGTGVTVARPPGAAYFKVGAKFYGIEARTVLTDLHATDVSDVRDAVLALVPPDTLPGLEARIDLEIFDRETADTAISANLADEAARAQAAEQSSARAIAAEATRAEGVEGGLRTDLAAEAARAEGIEGGLRTDLDAEATRALVAEAGLGARIGTVSGVVYAHLGQYFTDDLVIPAYIDGRGFYTEWTDAAGHIVDEDTARLSALTTIATGFTTRYFTDEVGIPAWIDRAGLFTEFDFPDGRAVSDASLRLDALASLKAGVWTPFFTDESATPAWIDRGGLFTEYDLSDGRAVSDAGRRLDTLTTAATGTLTAYFTDETIPPEWTDRAGFFVVDAFAELRQYDQARPGFYFSDDFVGQIEITGRGHVLKGTRIDGSVQAGLSPSASWHAYTVGAAPQRQAFAAATGLPPLAISTAEDVGDNLGATMPDPGTVEWLNINGSAVTLRRTSLLGGAATLSPTATSVLVLIGFGQSNTAGTASGSVLTATPPAPGSVLMFDVGGPRILGNEHGPPRYLDRVLPSQLENLVDAKEMLAGGAGETIMTMAGYEAWKRLGPTWAVVVADVAIGSQPYENLRKGTPPYANLLDVVRRTRILMGVRGLPVTLAVPWSGQEAHLGNSLADCLARIYDLQSTLTADATAILGTTTQVCLCVDGISDFTAYNFATTDMPLAQLQAALDNPGKITFATPTYLFPTAPDGVHKLAVGTAHEGAYFGRSIARRLQGLDCRPLYPTALTASAVSGGTQLVAAFNIPTAPLRLSDIVTDPGNLGVTCVRQSDGAAMSVRSAALTGGATQVTAIVDATASGTAYWIEFGLRGTAGAPAGPTTGARSAICDSSADVTLYGRSMLNHVAPSRLAFTAP